MNIMSMRDLPLEATPLGGNARILSDTTHLRVVNLILSPGERVSSHTAPMNVVFLVLEGKGSVTAANEKHEIKQGQIFTCPAHIERELEAGSSENLSLLVMRAPNL